MIRLFFLLLFALIIQVAVSQTMIWSKHQISFQSSKTYNNPIYEVSDFKVTFTAPSGREKQVCGFWDGGTDWKVRFLPDETGTWKWKTECSDSTNSGLQNQAGEFVCVGNSSSEAVFSKGAIRHEAGKYYLSYSDGTPFFWLACTAWNGALKSSDEEWEYYLNQRKQNQYNVIQLVTTEWRGCDKNAEGLTAIEGKEKIRIHPEFFKRIDQKIDEANAKGLLVSPVILWALPSGPGRELSPGYALPTEEAILLAKYIVARYQGNHVIWALGGDGQYYGDQEEKWKAIGRQVFLSINHAPVTLHPHGSSWIGELYAQEDWYDVMGYQSSHSNGKGVVNWINKGPMSQMWKKLKPMPYINLEPNYEEIGFKITAEDVRNASYWSIFATPVAGVTYGANGVWPWLRPGERILNHGDSGGVTGWRKSIDFPGSIQMSYLAGFIQQFEWWNLFPANEILAQQPGEETYNHWISVVKTPDDKTIIAYIPKKGEVTIFNPRGIEYTAQWFNPVSNKYSSAKITQTIAQNSKRKMKDDIQGANTITFTHDFENDMLMVLTEK
ncbi:DUF4038 domain-containing protein [Maribellus sp. YY47]|uniref:apiosidase-like domain-containing protein n=1 Tax=Maribellus sp. YY47 TaxID=2929486 RepID=UPI002001AD4A|nr:DUF4038 domain-containing protein [Maribellus sp. YY47]MCK3686017.1 DUF4038 domain-containing protein [Maribellus sp. YY47]